MSNCQIVVSLLYSQLSFATSAINFSMELFYATFLCNIPLQLSFATSLRNFTSLCNFSAQLLCETFLRNFLCGSEVQRIKNIETEKRDNLVEEDEETKTDGGSKIKSIPHY